MEIKIIFDMEKKLNSKSAEWKKRGCMQDYRFEHIYNIWLITRNGKLSARQLSALSEAAEKYGTGQVKITPRQIVSVEGIPEDKLDRVLKFLEGYGLMADSSDMLVRPVTACMGTTCKNGLIDTDSLSEKQFDHFFTGWAGVELPQKFKIGISGCPNNCAKADLNDVGIIGIRTPLPDYDKCQSCTICQVEKACRKTHAAAKLTGETVSKLLKAGTAAEDQTADCQENGHSQPCIEEGKLYINEETCISCGRCKDKCAFGVLDRFRDGYRIRIGGQSSHKVERGRELPVTFSTEEEVSDMVEKILVLFRDKGIQGERLADTIDRLGWDSICRDLLR